MKTIKAVYCYVSPVIAETRIEKTFEFEDTKTLSQVLEEISLHRPEGGDFIELYYIHSTTEQGKIERYLGWFRVGWTEMK